MQDVDARQIDDAEVVGRRPVEACALHDQHLFLFQQIERELHVVGDVELLHIELGEDVEGRLGLHHGYAVDVFERVVDEVALLEHAPARHHIVLHALVAPQRRLDDGLRRHVRAQAHVREHVEPLDVAAARIQVARQHHPPHAVSCDHVRFGQAGKGDAKQVGCQRGDGGELGVVHDQAVVDLVGEYDELFLAGQLDDFLQQLLGIERARGVVRVDDDDGLCALGDLCAHVVHVGQPAGLLVADVVDGTAASKRRACRPQRIVRRRDQNLVAVIEQGLQAQVDQLGNTVARVDVLDVDIRQVARLRVLHDGLARRVETLGRRVALAFGQLARHVVDDLVGRAKTEGCGVADIELQDMRAHLLHAGGFLDHGPAHVIAHAVQLG